MIFLLFTTGDHNHHSAVLNRFISQPTQIHGSELALEITAPLPIKDYGEVFNL